MTHSQNGRGYLNEAAAKLVEFYWAHADQPGSLMPLPLGWLCHTMASDPASTAAIIRRAIAPNELARAGYTQAPQIAAQIGAIAAVDARLAAEVYDAVFSYEETDRSATPMGTLTLPMASNRKQDYEMSYYRLAEAYPAFVEVHSAEATRAAIQVAEHYWMQQREHGGVPAEEGFVWDGQTCRLQADGSSLWDDIEYHHSDHLKIAKAWGDFMASLPAAKDPVAAWEQIKDILCATNRLAVIWRLLLQAGVRSPGFYAPLLSSLLCTFAILFNPDTLDDAGDLLAACLPYLTSEAVHDIQAAILEVVARQNNEKRDTGRDRYIRFAAAQLLERISDERREPPAQAFLDTCEPELRRPYRRRSSLDGSATPLFTAWPAGQRGGRPDTPEREALDHASALDLIAASAITEETLASTLDRIGAAEQALRQLQSNGGALDESVVGTLRASILFAFSQVACSEASLSTEYVTKLVNEFSQGISGPPSVPTIDATTGLAGWTPGDADVHAAQGFICLAVKADSLPSEWEGLLRQLARHDNPAVRSRLGERLWHVLQVWPEFVWDTLDRWVEDLAARGDMVGVLRVVLRDSWFWWLYNRDADRAGQLLRRLHVMARQQNNASLRDLSGLWLAAACFYRDEPYGCEALREALSAFEDNMPELIGASRAAIALVLPREQNSDELPRDQVERARDFLIPLLRRANDEIDRHEVSEAAASETRQPEEMPASVKALVGLIQDTTTEFHFSAQSLAAFTVEAGIDRTPTRQQAWWTTAEQLLEVLLVEPRYPRSLANIIDGLGHTAQFDAAKSLHWLRIATEGGTKLGLAGDPIAAQHTMEILAVALAENRTSLAEEGDVHTDFVSILDSYLQAGWPSAMQLAVDIDSIYR